MNDDKAIDGNLRCSSTVATVKMEEVGLRVAAAAHTWSSGIHPKLLQAVDHLVSPPFLCLWKKTRPLSDVPWAPISKWDTLRCPHAHVLINMVMYARVLAKAHNHICAV